MVTLDGIWQAVLAGMLELPMKLQSLSLIIIIMISRIAIMHALIICNGIRGSRKQDHKGYKEGSCYFQIHGTPSKSGKGSMHIHERLE